MTAVLNQLGNHPPALYLAIAGVLWIFMFSSCRTDAGNPIGPAAPVPTSTPISTATATSPSTSAQSTPTPTSPATVPASSNDLPDPVRNLRDTLIQDLDLPTSEVRVLRFREQFWSSTALGCPEPGRSYPQIVTSGYEVEMLVGAETRVFHISLDGRTVDCTAGTP